MNLAITGLKVDAKGEGSRGGKIIGHTSSGKPIYASHGHPSHGKFTGKDHEEAMGLFTGKFEKASKAFHEIRETGARKYGIDETHKKMGGVRREMNSHLEQVEGHNKLLNAKLEKNPEEKKAFWSRRASRL